MSDPAHRLHLSATRILATTFLVLFGVVDRVHAETFSFGFSANNLLGASSKSLVAGDFGLNLVAGPPGAGLWETNSIFGMGVDATNLLGPGGQAARFDRINGTSEYIEFSFDRPGILTGLNFDGVKDESLEYFLLETPGVRVNLFDSFANTTIPGAVDNAIVQGALTGEIVYLLENGIQDDETIDLAIPFAAGQMFRLTYMEVGGGLGSAFEPTEIPNGARLQGITVAAVPEPAAGVALAIGGALLIGPLIRRYRQSAK